MLFTCRQCDGPEGGCDCETRQPGDDRKRGKRNSLKALEAVECESRPLPSSESLRIAYSVPSNSHKRLTRAEQALKAAAAELSREKLLQSYKERGLCSNGRKMAAQRDSMRRYMRVYRARKRADAMPASEAADIAKAA